VSPAVEVHGAAGDRRRQLPSEESEELLQGRDSSIDNVSVPPAVSLEKNSLRISEILPTKARAQLLDQSRRTVELVSADHLAHSRDAPSGKEIAAVIETRSPSA
jgi:hypothetical protein